MCPVPLSRLLMRARAAAPVPVMGNRFARRVGNTLHHKLGTGARSRAVPDQVELRFTLQEVSDVAAPRITATLETLNQRGDGHWVLVAFGPDGDKTEWVARFARKPN